MEQRRVPLAIAPPKGLTGILEGHAYEPGSVLETSSFPDGMVLLNVYDVSDGDLFTRINKVTTANDNILWGGVFHAGVEVYGKEWCYGVTEYGRTGVCAVAARTHPQHTYRCTVPLGVTKTNEEDVETLLRRLSQEWPGHEYDLIHHNCISFCNALLSELLPGGRVPGWVDRAMRTAGFIDITSKKVMEGTHQTAELVKSLSKDLQHKATNTSAAEALDIAQKTSEEVGRQASEHMNVFGNNLKEWGEGLRVSAERGIEEGEIEQKAELVRRKTQESIDDIGEKAQALGASLWSWGQGLQGKSVWGLADEARASVSSYVEGPSNSSPSAPATQIATKGLLDEDDDSLLHDDHSIAGDRSNVGLITGMQDRGLKQGLLAEDDSDEEDGHVDLLGMAAALQDNGAQSAPSGYIVEKPAELSSGASSSAMQPSSASSKEAPAAGGDIWDLLTPADSHQVKNYAEVDQPTKAWFPPTPHGKEADPLDGVDLMS